MASQFSSHIGRMRSPRLSAHPQSRNESVLAFAIAFLALVGCEQTEVLPGTDNTRGEDFAETLNARGAESYLYEMADQTDLNRWIAVDLDAEGILQKSESEEVQWIWGPSIVRKSWIENFAFNDRCSQLLAEKCPNLIILDMQHSSITDEGLETLAELRELRLLILGTTKVTSAGVEQFLETRPECILRVFPREVTYEHGSAESPRIVLNAPGSDESVRAIAVFHEIRQFEAAEQHGSFRSGYDLTDEALMALSELPNLEEIVIWNPSGITDAGLQVLYGRGQLRDVSIIFGNVGRAPLSDVAVSGLREALPDCNLFIGPGGN